MKPYILIILKIIKHGKELFKAKDKFCCMVYDFKEKFFYSGIVY